VATAILKERDGVEDYDLGLTRTEVFVATEAMAKEAKVTPKAMGAALAIIAVQTSVRCTIRKGYEPRGAWLRQLWTARRAFAAWLGAEVDWPNDDGRWASSIAPMAQAAE